MKTLLGVTLVSVTLSLFGCSSTEKENEDNKIQIEIPSGEDIAAIKVGLVAYYKFDDNTGSDETSNEFDATLINTPQFISDTPSGNGKALFLRKEKKQYIDIYHQIFYNTTYSASIWIKDFGPGVIFSSISTDNIYDYPCFAAISSSGNFEFYTNNRAKPSLSYAFSYPFSSLQDGKWHLLVVTHAPVGKEKQCEKKLYIDGNLIANCEGVYDIPTAIKMQIGGDGDGHYTSFSNDMKIDNIRFYDRVLNVKDVKSIYDLERIQ